MRVSPKSSPPILTFIKCKPFRGGSKVRLPGFKSQLYHLFVDLSEFLKLSEPVSSSLETDDKLPHKVNREGE